MERKLRAVVDNNLMVSGLFGKQSLSAKLRDLWINQDFQLVTSMSILKELSRVLQYPKIQERFHPKEETIKRFFRLIFRKAVITKDLYITERLTDDPSDNIFLACALEGKADYIISRDAHLLNIKQYQRIEIVEVPAFMEIVKSLSTSPSSHL